MARARLSNSQRDEIHPYPQESLLIGALGEMSGKRLLCTSLGLAQFAHAAAKAMPLAEVSCTYLDLYRATLALEHGHSLSPNLRIDCAADLPQSEADVAAFPLSSGGEADLARDLLQAGHERLRLGGKMYAATENRYDTWLGEQLRKLFRKLERRESPDGVLYVAAKTEPLKKLKNYACEFAFRDRGRLIRAYSRPGVFSHRHIDPGSRQLIEEMQIVSGARILDIGCGAGVVSLAAACRVEGVQVHAVDSNARAVECTRRGAELNGLTNVTTELNADGNFASAGDYDLALANPPYYSGFRIARHFLAAGYAALRPGGIIFVVTKHPDWYRQQMPEWYTEVSETARKGYCIFRGVRSA